MYGVNICLEMLIRLIRSLKKFIFRYQDVVKLYSVSAETIINDGFHIVKMYKDKEVNKNVKNIFLSMCDVKMFLTFTFVVKILQVTQTSFIIVSAETEYNLTTSWYRNINFLRDRIRRIF
jgi:hypothetical protein